MNREVVDMGKKLKFLLRKLLFVSNICLIVTVAREVFVHEDNDKYLP
jgi:hypothetical protein